MISNRRIRMPKCSSGRTSTTSWPATVARILILLASWRTVRKPIGTLCAFCMVQEIPKFLWRAVSALVFFHWKQSLEKHTKLYIKHELQDQHKHLCLQYRNASSMAEAETRYLAIKAWWASSNCTSEEGLKHLQLWLAF